MSLSVTENKPTKITSMIMLPLRVFLLYLKLHEMKYLFTVISCHNDPQPRILFKITNKKL